MRIVGGALSKPQVALLISRSFGSCSCLYGVFFAKHNPKSIATDKQAERSLCGGGTSEGIEG